MEIKFIKCNLIDIKELDKGSYFALQNIDTKEIITIYVDESKSRILNRVKDVLDNKRENIFLSRNMTNINIHTSKKYDWDINEETGEIYKFNQKDIEKILKNNRI